VPTEYNAPIDELHALCLIELTYIRMEFAAAINAVRRWEPAPIPTEREET
jgi:hypothetical protein